MRVSPGGGVSQPGARTRHMCLRPRMAPCLASKATGSTSSSAPLSRFFLSVSSLAARPSPLSRPSSFQLAKNDQERTSKEREAPSSPSLSSSLLQTSSPASMAGGGRRRRRRRHRTGHCWALLLRSADGKEFPKWSQGTKSGIKRNIKSLLIPSHHRIIYRSALFTRKVCLNLFRQRRPYDFCGRLREIAF